MTENIELLLKKLSNDSFAHQLVDKLKDSEQQDWHAILEAFLKSRFHQKVQELAHGKDQTPQG